MRRFVILGHPNDLHAHYVAWALEEAGYHTDFINSSHDNCAIRTTLYIDKAADSLTSADWNETEAVWCRRLSPPLVYDTTVSESDEFTSLEERRFTKWLIQLLERCPVRWINQPTAAQAAENKFIQLKFARSHGIGIPRTLVTTQPDRFRVFLKTEGVVVAKALDAYSWKEESGETLSVFATVLDVERGSQLSDESIRQCVTMYQQCIDKVADIRMVVMGADLFAYKIIQNGEQHFDFRIGFYQENHLRYEAIPVPASLKKKMTGLMDSLRINFASADFALQADGEWVFLDLNANGQWLFIEHRFPESRIGQKFCSFFVNGKVNAEGEKLFPSFAEYADSDAGRSSREAFHNHLAVQALSTSSRKKEAWVE